MEDTSREKRLAIRNPQVPQLYSAQTPNGIKVAAALEEILLLKSQDFKFDYEPHTVDIRHGESREQSFLQNICPNGKVPVLVDSNGPDGNTVKVFESGAILLYLAEKYKELLPLDPLSRVEVQKWLFFGSATVSPQFKTFGFYYRYCPHRIEYCIERYTKSCCRILAVLEAQLSGHNKHWMIGDLYTIADLAIWPWVYGLLNNYGDAGQTVFKQLVQFPKVKAWYERCMARPASQNSLGVCPFFT